MKLIYVISIVLPGIGQVFKKLLGGKEAPKNTGKSSSFGQVKEVHWVKKFTLELSNMEGTPSYQLTHQITVGSEVGNIVIADPSVSPRHCTFVLQEDVVSILDHGSVSGTVINDQRIPPGRYIILEESDVVMAGDLEIRILVKNEAVEKEASEEISEDDSGEEPPQYEDIKETKKVSKNHKKPTLSLVVKSSYATNSLVRLIAVIGDLLIAYSLCVVFSPFDEFRSFVSDVFFFIENGLDINSTHLIAALNEEFGLSPAVVNDLIQFFSSTFHVGSILLVFIVLRLLTTLLFGVSFSEAVLGVRSHGNAIWKRIGGGIRVLLGVITGPLIIFDVPAVISKRTAKEYLSFTHTYLHSKFIAILGTVLYLPLLIALTLFSPLFQGLELPEPLAVNDRLDKRMKVAVPTDSPLEVAKMNDSSKFLNMDLEYNGNELSLVPLFKFSGQNKKIHYKPSLVIYHKELQRAVEVEVFKTFDLKELLGIGLKGNFFLFDKFPEIYNFVYSAETANGSFKTRPSTQGQIKFADEIVSFTKIAFELSAENAVENMQTYTPLLKSLMDYRSSFLGLVEYKEFDQLDFFKLGNAYFLRLSYMRQKPFDLIIPLIKGEGKILKISFDKKENVGNLKTKFYKFSLDQSNWYSSHQVLPEGETLKPLEVLDFFSKQEMKSVKVSSEKAQALYGYYYEKSADVLKRADSVEYDLWKRSVDSIFTIMEKMKTAIQDTAPAPSPDMPVELDPRTKLLQNFQDLKDAFENKNGEYFGISESTSV